VDARVKPGHDD
jgi:hypothetical protein